MTKSLQAWGSGTLLCCSTAAFLALKSGPASAIAVGGLLVVVIGHAMVGFLAIRGDGGRDGSGRLVTVFCAVAAVLSTAIQIGMATLLIAVLRIQLDPSDATWLTVVAAMGQLWILALASRRFHAGFRTRASEHHATLNPGPSAAPTHS